MLLLAGYLLLFPPLFVLGPLAGLLLASRPGSPREWAWISASGLWLAMSVWQSGGLAVEMLHAFALFVTAAFVVLMLAGRRSIVAGALLASTVGLGLATVWVRVLGTSWHEIQLAVAHHGWELRRALLAEVAADAPLAARTFLDAIAQGVAVVADLFPAVLVLTALPGLALAWGWYHRLAARPAGSPVERFADFRFSDQLVWAVVLSVAVLVVPVPAAVAAVAGNIACVAGGLYVARGAAILWTTLRSFPTVVLLAAGVGVLIVLPVALGGLFALGLADTWVDFRRRFQPAGLTRE